LSEGAVFSSSNQPFVAEKMRLGAYGATSLIVRITALKEGLKNLTGNYVKNALCLCSAGEYSTLFYSIIVLCHSVA
jgi:hypothetical protein